MKNHTRILYVVLYLLILLTVFLLFSAISNTSAGSAGIYTAIFVLILISTSQFVMAIMNYTPFHKEVENAGLEITNQPISDKNANLKENTISSMDVESLIPGSANDIENFGETLLKNMANKFNIVQALFYGKEKTSENYHCYAQYAYFSETKPEGFAAGETLPGQAVKNKGIVSINNIPDNYMTIISGLGQGSPKSLVFVPLKQKDEVVALIEYATFEKVSDESHKALEKLSSLAAESIINLLN